MKPLRFAGTSQDDLRRLPPEARRDAGYQLWQVQLGRMPSDYKTMTQVGPGAFEIRVHADGEWRVICVAKLREAVVVLHVFEKKTQKTRGSDLRLARRRYLSTRFEP